MSELENIAPELKNKQGGRQQVNAEEEMSGEILHVSNINTPRGVLFNILEASRYLPSKRPSGHKYHMFNEAKLCAYHRDEKRNDID